MGPKQKDKLSKEGYSVSPATEKDWIQQIRLSLGGLIAIAIVMIQPFLTNGPLTDTSAKICVVALGFAIPMLAALMLLNYEEAFRARLARSAWVSTAKSIAQLSAFIGIVAGFWHISRIAGLAVLVGSFIGMAVHSIGYSTLMRDKLG